MQSVQPFPRYGKGVRTCTCIPALTFAKRQAYGPPTTVKISCPSVQPFSPSSLSIRPAFQSVQHFSALLGLLTWPRSASGQTGSPQQSWRIERRPEELEWLEQSLSGGGRSPGVILPPLPARSQPALLPGDDWQRDCRLMERWVPAPNCRAGRLSACNVGKSVQCTCVESSRFVGRLLYAQKTDKCRSIAGVELIPEMCFK